MALPEERTSGLRELLYMLGITANYTGFSYVSYAVHLAVQQPERLLLITKWLYPDVAKHYKTTWKCVERNIRAMISITWKWSPALLEKLAMRPLNRKPTAAQFIAVLALYISRTDSPDDAA